jgi:hypothetical protein
VFSLVEVGEVEEFLGEREKKVCERERERERERDHHHHGVAASWHPAEKDSASGSCCGGGVSGFVFVVEAVLESARE